MCAHIYLNGDSLGKNMHFSFFVIMRGPYDALLPWPFRQKVTLTLLNQTGKKHVTDHFHPDPHSSSFQHPRKREVNISSSCPMFIRIEHFLNGVHHTLLPLPFWHETHGRNETTARYTAIQNSPQKWPRKAENGPE